MFKQTWYHTITIAIIVVILFFFNKKKQKKNRKTTARHWCAFLTKKVENHDTRLTDFFETPVLLSKKDVKDTLNPECVKEILNTLKINQGSDYADELRKIYDLFK